MQLQSEASTNKWALTVIFDEGIHFLFIILLWKISNMFYTCFHLESD